MFAGAIPRYLADHWFGRHSLAWAFWVNLVLLRLLINFGQWLLRPAIDEDHADQRALVLALAVFFHGAFFVWQVVGVLRAGEAQLRRRESITSFWGAQLGTVIAFWITASFAWEAWQMTLPVPAEEDFAERARRERAASYQISASPSGTAISFDGTVALGATRELSSWLERHPNVHTLILTSSGGNIFAARGMSTLVHARGLATLVEQVCSSACTTVFISGRQRSMSRSAKLGFHKYRWDARYDVLGHDLAAQQDRDRALFARQGVEAPFLEKMYDAASDGIWYPSAQELLDAGVVHTVK